ncbi:MAG: hypothetical protein M0Q91_07185 [Methanoregula sp.]|jgi:cation transport ATPase|nr:hypothetical protein [Methanoregula sp.]
MLPDTSDNKKRECEKERDAIQRVFQRPFFLSLTIGIPFCIFKLLFGITALRTGSTDNLLLSISGWLVILWALTDLLMNTGRSTLDLLHRPAPFEYCIIAQAGQYFHKPMVFLAVDTLLAFCIICAMLWSGWITRLTLFELYLWYSATTMNLISLSLVGIYNEIRTA